MLKNETWGFSNIININRIVFTINMVKTIFFCSPVL